VNMKHKKIFPIPSDIRWCLYLSGKIPTGEVGHICKGFDTGHAVMSLFTMEDNKPTWVTEHCTHCKEKLPIDIKETLRFITL